MLLGEHEHSLDDKNRLTLPAKLREQLGDEVVDHAAAWTDASSSMPGPPSRSLPRGSGRSTRSAARRGRMQRHFFAGAPRAELDKQGRMVIPAQLLEECGHRPRGHGRRRRRPPRDLGSRRVARAAATSRRERRRCCRASCQPRLTTSPSSPTRCSPPSTPRPGETVVDCTFGAGGHSELLVGRLRGEGKLIAIDRDPTVAPYFERLRRSTRGQDAAAPRRVLAGARPARRRTACSADAILLDLGVSSMQLDRPERGFSYAADAPLDMRMDPSAELTAARRRQRDRTSASSPTSSAATARSATRARSRARSCAAARKQPFERTGDLVETIKQAIPAPARFGEGHPAKRVFQALRIEVNDELGALERALPAALEMLRPHGRLAVISFHSLEDRIVKRFLRDAGARLHVPARLPGLRLRRARRRCVRFRGGRSGRPRPRSPATRARSRRASAWR